LATLNTLIEIYGRQNADNVKNDAEYVALCLEHDALNDPFHPQRERVERIKRSLEDQVAIQPSYQAQVSHALKLFQRLVGSRNQEEEICRQLTLRTYYPNWSQQQKDYFDETCSTMANKLDYFLSFTQRNSSGNANPINGYHRFLIRVAGSMPDPLDSTDNELARMLDRLLRSRQFTGFYFPMHEGNSQQVNQKLTTSLMRSLVFIQLVQNEMFAKVHAGKPNYCFEEYSQAVAEKKKMIFLFADGQHPQDLIQEPDVPLDLDPWYQFIRGTDCVFMESTQFAQDSPNIEAGYSKLRKSLVEMVQKHRAALWEDAPGDL
jgi:hypothetical protein